MSRESIPSPSELQLTPCPVIDQRLLAPEVFLLRLKKLDDFQAGQFVALSLEHGGVSRLYSIASGTTEEYIDLLYDVKPEGLLTPQLSRLKRGDRVFVSRPFGSFLGDQKPAWWIAAGTGIAPFASMFYSGLHDQKILIHGARTIDSFYFSSDFLPVMEERYIRCCSRETADGMYNGRLTEYLKSVVAFPKDQKYYLCGSVEMVVEVRDILIAAGVPYSQILAEIFF
jgi:ferredoxin/flavodoxin---NADP+ reductase